MFKTSVDMPALAASIERTKCNILTYTCARKYIRVSLLHLQVVTLTQLASVQICKAGCYEIELLQADDVLSRQTAPKNSATRARTTCHHVENSTCVAL